MNKSNHLLLASLVAIAFTIFPAGAVEAATGWAVVTTEQGCKAYWAYDPSFETKAEVLSKNAFSWDSACEAGQLINGFGVLKVVFEMDSGNHGIIPYRGRMVDGAFDGAVERLTQGYGGAPAGTPWRVYDTRDYRMGCQTNHGWCTPRRPGAASASSSEADADAEFAAKQREYEQKLAAQQKAVADYQVAQRQLAADNAAAAARASAAHEQYARERAEYEAQLSGQTVSAQGSGTLGPLSAGGPQAKPVQEGLDAHVIASDGKSAMDCVQLVELTKADSSTSGGGRVLSNQCEVAVEITWCYVDTECTNGLGAMWTVAAGRSWPVSAEREIRWAACRGANTVAFEKGSAGLRFICSAPAK